MEYVRDRGPSADVPAEAIIETFERFRDEATPMAEPPGS